MMTKFSHKLKDKDEFLYNRIRELDLKPQYYAFRWLTLLLSQEFPLPGNAIWLISSNQWAEVMFVELIIACNFVLLEFTELSNEFIF